MSLYEIVKTFGTLDEAREGLALLEDLQDFIDKYKESDSSGDREKILDCFIQFLTDLKKSPKGKR